MTSVVRAAREELRGEVPTSPVWHRPSSGPGARSKSADLRSRLDPLISAKPSEPEPRPPRSAGSRGAPPRGPPQVISSPPKPDPPRHRRNSRPRTADACCDSSREGIRLSLLRVRSPSCQSASEASSAEDSQADDDPADEDGLQSQGFSMPGATEANAGESVLQLDPGLEEELMQLDVELQGRATALEEAKARRRSLSERLQVSEREVRQYQEAVEIIEAQLEDCTAETGAPHLTRRQGVPLVSPQASVSKQSDSQGASQDHSQGACDMSKIRLAMGLEGP
eukprot:TRINITY_DN47827_c0_g1_i1.p1 TRINITY_DN47827_c0_g1~~TRINITY_DN47827_c0_g1_i1.p1  ORF type:complete len:281 (+),score=49.36 TRINITY_DN47827_c0_g1_i1:103-945(+)